MKVRHMITLIALVFFACNDDFLDRQPIDSVTPDKFYADANNLSIGLTGVYDGLTEHEVYGSLPLLDAISDNGISIADSPELINFATGSRSADVSGRIANFYLFSFQIISRANLLLDNIDVPGAITDTERATIEAEAKALRAIAYFRLVYLFGDIPIIETTLSRDEFLAISREPRAEVIAFILDELENAASVLNTEPFNGEKGRLTRQALLAFSARIMLYEARLGNKTWSEALTAIEAAQSEAQNAGAGLVNIGGSGMENFEAVFSTDNEQNEEMLFSIGFDYSTFSDGQSSFTSYSIRALNGNERMIIHSDFVNDFYTTDGLPITDPSSIFDADDPHKNRDPRLQASLYVDNLDYPFLGSIYSGDPFFRKFGPAEVFTASLDYDIPVIRYAEVLLMLAEAENEVNNGPNDAAYDAINAVRARVNMPDVTTGLSKDGFRDEVIHERRVEFAFEGIRWFDLVTLGIASDRINNLGEHNRMFIVGTHEHFPIPQSERDLNPNLSQNPGYTQ